MEQVRTTIACAAAVTPFRSASHCEALPLSNSHCWLHCLSSHTGHETAMHDIQPSWLVGLLMHNTLICQSFVCAARRLCNWLWPNNGFHVLVELAFFVVAPFGLAQLMKKATILFWSVTIHKHGSFWPILVEVSPAYMLHPVHRPCTCHGDVWGFPSTSIIKVSPKYQAVKLV